MRVRCRGGGCVTESWGASSKERLTGAINSVMWSREASSGFG